MKALKMICAAAVALAMAPAARAQDPESLKTTILTFSGPVSMPGMTLPAGSYRFQIADPDTSRKVIEVRNQDGTKAYGMFLTMPNERIEPTGKPVVMFSEAPAGSAPAVKAWFYPGERMGYEFIYPKAQAISIAKASHESVLSAENGHGETAASVKGANVGRVDAEGNPVDENNRPVATSGTAESARQSRAPAPAPAPAAQPNTNPTPQSTATTAGTSARNTAQANPSARRTLPRTASNLGLVELLSGLSLAGAFGAAQLRKRLANRA